MANRKHVEDDPAGQRGSVDEQRHRGGSEDTSAFADDTGDDVEGEDNEDLDEEIHDDEEEGNF